MKKFLSKNKKEKMNSNNYQQQTDLNNAQNYDANAQYQQQTDLNNAQNYDANAQYQQQTDLNNAQIYDANAQYQQQTDLNNAQNYDANAQYQQQTDLNNAQNYDANAQYQQQTDLNNAQNYDANAQYQQQTDLNNAQIYDATTQYQQPTDLNNAQIYDATTQYQQPTDLNNAQIYDATNNQYQQPTAEFSDQQTQQYSENYPQTTMPNYYPQTIAENYPQNTMPNYYPQTTMPNYYPQKTHNNKKSIIIGTVAVLLTIAVILAVTLPLTLNKNKNDSGNNNISLDSTIFANDDFTSKSTYYKDTSVNDFKSDMESIILTDVNANLTDNLVAGDLTYDWNWVNFDQDGLYSLRIFGTKDGVTYTIPDAPVSISQYSFINLDDIDIASIIDMDSYVTTDYVGYEADFEHNFLTNLSQQYHGDVNDEDIHFEYSSTTATGKLDLSQSVEAGGKDLNNQIMIEAADDSSSVVGSKSVKINPKAYAISSDLLYGSNHLDKAGTKFTEIHMDDNSGDSGSADNYFDLTGVDSANSQRIVSEQKAKISSDFDEIRSDSAMSSIIPVDSDIQTYLDFSGLPRDGKSTSDDVKYWTSDGNSSVSQDSSWDCTWVMATLADNGVFTGKITMTIHFSIMDY